MASSRAWATANIVRGLLISFGGAQYVLPIVPREDFENSLPPGVPTGFTLYELGNDDKEYDHGGES